LYWQIHHIIPLWTFNLENKKERLEAFHHTNCFPLEIEEHKLVHRLIGMI